ncbi:ABC transporter permease [Marinactinospora thermotolerans]|uniref:Transport permease protein n=2 Tax=Marinactinospora thermotolerans TaxID=531310 RepID=A0A1T4SL21_9ACTN|nr:ABC transporter permease [Marinactinospora thermotolerans]ARW80054.1 putative ABC-2 type transporter [Marinactinospora thermotolerans]SKA28980.1 ABC-2 type transport system permease protein [Marinactinospora thermotolerans DSM 45154]
MTSIVAPSDRGAVGDERDRSSTFGAELRAGRMVWWREMLHFLRDPARTAVSLFQPLIFLFILGVGLSRLYAQAGADPGAGADYLVFLFPGVLVMAAQVPAVSVGASIVWDRQSGFLREMLVAPVRRSTLLIGKCLGGATVATCTGTVVLLCCGLVGVPYRFGLSLLLLAELGLASLVMTALGALVAVTIRRIQTFNIVLGVLMTPLLFLSGAVFPVAAMPTWMVPVALVNPLTYTIDAMRRTIAHYTEDGVALADPVAWGTWHPPVLLELGLAVGFSVVLLALAARRFARID